jgi:putative ABC transport system ATP-binding protein
VGGGTTQEVLMSELSMTPTDVSNVAGSPDMAARAVGVSKVYGEGNTRVVALDDVDIGFEAGKLTAIMGPSGSGKSTLLHCMAGLDSVSEGETWIGDTLISGLSDRELTLLRRQRLGFIFQAFNLVPTLTAEENILLPLLLGEREPDAEWAEEVIDSLQLDERLTHRPDELSGGQQQRVAVARALVSRPEIIFADEPTGNLDSRSGSEVLTFLRQAVDDWGQTVVMVTHDAVAASFADRVVFLRDGVLVGELSSPTADEVIDQIKELEV